MRLHIKTNVIRMDFVMPDKWLLHFHVPSDIIFRAFHYFALIKCGHEERSRATTHTSVHSLMEVSLENNHCQTGLTGLKNTHTRLAVFEKVINI